MLFEDTGFHFDTWKQSSFTLRTLFDAINFLKEVFISPHLVQPDVEFNVMEPELPLWLVCMTTLADACGFCFFCH